jgi:hypothetical protein
MGDGRWEMNFNFCDMNNLREPSGRFSPIAHRSSAIL